MFEIKTKKKKTEIILNREIITLKATLKMFKTTNTYKLTTNNFPHNFTDNDAFVWSTGNAHHTQKKKQKKKMLEVFVLKIFKI